MKIQKKINIAVVMCLALCFMVFAILAFHIYSYYYSFKKEFNSSLVSAFQESVIKDMEIRKQKLSEQFYFGLSSNVDVDSTTIISSGKIGKKRRTNIDEKTKDKVVNVIQSVLYDKNPIRVNILDSLLHIELNHRDIECKSVILYIDKNRNQTFWSNKIQNINDFVPVLPNPIDLGVKDEMSLQAYYKFSPLQIYARMPLSYWFAILGWLVLVAALIIAIPILQKRAKKQVAKQFADQLLELSLQHEETPRAELVIEEEKMTPLVNKNLITISENLSFDKQNWKLYDNGKSVPLAPQSAKALHCFLQAPQYFLSTKDIRLKVWGTEDIQDTAIRGCISRLNRDLVNTQGMRVVNLPREGYRLEVEYPIVQETTEDNTLLSLNE